MDILDFASNYTNRVSRSRVSVWKMMGVVRVFEQYIAGTLQADAAIMEQITTYISDCSDEDDFVSELKSDVAEWTSKLAEIRPITGKVYAPTI